MTQPLYSDHDSARAVLSILDYLTELFAASGHEQFSKESVLKILDLVRSDPELLDPQVVLAHLISTRAMEQEAAN